MPSSIRMTATSAQMAEMLAASHTKTIDHTFRMRHAKGDWVWLRARAELVRETPDAPAHLVGIAVDTSEQKILAERSATADMRLRDALEAVSEAFVLWDKDNRLVMCNSKFQRFHNLPEGRCQSGLAYRDVMAQGTPPLIQSQIALGERPQPARRLTRRGLATAAGCRSTSAAPKMGAMFLSAPTLPRSNGIRSNCWNPNAG